MVKKLGDKGFITFLLATVILVLAGLYDAEIGKDFLSTLATIISAILAVSAVSYNVWNQNRLADNARERKLIAAKASLSVALNDIVSLCEAHIEYLANGSNGTLDLKQISKNSIENIQLVIEHTEEDNRDSIIFLLNAYQILMSRNRDFTYCEIDWPLAVEERNNEQKDSQILSKTNTAQRIIDWVSYKALVNIQFDYARTSNKIPDIASMRSSFENDLGFVRYNEMWLLTNDKIFKQIFDNAVKNKESGFFKPKYFSMNRIVS